MELIKAKYDPTPFDEVLAETCAKVKKALTATNEEYGWVPVSHQCEGITSFSKTVEGTAVPFLKSFTTLPVDVNIARRLLAHLKYRSTWDDRFVEADVVKIYNPTCIHVRTQFRAPWPVSARDFSVVVHTQLTDDETGYFVVSRSVVSEDCPEQSGIVRGTIPIFGYFITPNKENPDHTDVAYCLSTDPAGSIPDFIVKGLTMSVTDMLHGLRTNVMPKPELIKEISDSFIETYETVAQ